MTTAPAKLFALALPFGLLVWLSACLRPVPLGGGDGGMTLTIASVVATTAAEARLEFAGSGAVEQLTIDGIAVEATVHADGTITAPLPEHVAAVLKRDGIVDCEFALADSDEPPFHATLTVP